MRLMLDARLDISFAQIVLQRAHSKIKIDCFMERKRTQNHVSFSYSVLHKNKGHLTRDKSYPVVSRVIWSGSQELIFTFF